MNKEILRNTPFDPELSAGARNAVRTCLGIQPEEKTTLITDYACLEIAASLSHELEAIGASYQAFILEELAPRPLASMPPQILADLETSTASIYAVWAQPNELKTRMEMMAVVNRRHIRHGHMVNIDKQIMMEGMRADFIQVDEISIRVRDIVRRASFIRARTPAGTDLLARISPHYNWLKTSGLITPAKWGNLPGGEVFTTPEEVNGTFVIDGVVGDYLCAKYGDLRHTPLTIHIERSRLVAAECSNQELRDAFWAYTHTDENSDRVGEFAIGTNIAIRDVIGNILQDEKIPGVHIAFGNPYGEHTGAKWRSTTHIDVVGRNFDIWADDRQIMRSGRFTLEQ
ncbi:MAG: aminopeptidase [Bryobacteraceae bacterium]|nr:aminopeptidase [Bryobacteraceae bacterium]MDW8377955.1 aminopeptidase [Bryobacterales bacterium]